jgi:hypothetical protein
LSATGCIDALTSSGFLEGWGHDPERLGQALEIAVLFRKREVGRGLANRFRWDLADLACGIGWCAFRLRVDGMISALRRGPLVLIDVERNAEIVRTVGIPVVEDSQADLLTLIDVAQTDPTVIRHVDQLRGCGLLFERYVACNGAEAFVRAAYVYILGRPADASGLENYIALLTSGELAPYGLLQALHDSDEFQFSPRLLSAPTEPGFVFAMP